MACLVVLYFMNLLFLQFLVLHTYEELLERNCHCAVNVLCHILGFCYELCKSGVNLIEISQILKF